MMNLIRTARFYKLKFMRLKGDPKSLAIGVALGTFIGITPTIPLHTIMIIVLAFLLRCSVVSALLASVIVSNPLTFFFQYFFSWKIGNMLTPHDVSWKRIASVMQILTSDATFSEAMSALGQLGTETLIALLVGGCILAAPFSLASYFMSFKFFETIQARRRKKKCKQMAKDLDDHK